MPSMCLEDTRTAPEPPTESRCDLCKLLWRESAMVECLNCRKWVCPECATRVEAAANAPSGTALHEPVCRNCAEAYEECVHCHRLTDSRNADDDAECVWCGDVGARREEDPWPGDGRWS